MAGHGTPGVPRVLGYPNPIATGSEAAGTWTKRAEVRAPRSFSPSVFDATEQYFESLEIFTKTPKFLREFVFCAVETSQSGKVFH